ncbi:MAG: hypothetical protein CW346_15850 [Bacillaceae bacterium]|mgnify:CR=1 FL=1|nr:hypothetical protein [Bacillaceae bacterium]
MGDIPLLTLTFATIALIGGSLFLGVRAVRRSRSGWLWLGVALVLTVCIVGPRVSITGLYRFSGDERRYAEQALAHAASSLSSPPLFHLLGGPLRVVSLRPLPSGTMDHLGTGPCEFEVVLRSYGAFWIPARTIKVRCGTLEVQR